MTEHCIPDWRHRAACCNHREGPHLWFAEHGSTAALAAKAVCAGCPVAAECAADAVRHGDRGAVIAGHHTANAREWSRLVASVTSGCALTAPAEDVGRPRECPDCGRIFTSRSRGARCDICKRGVVAAGPSVQRVRELHALNLTYAEIADLVGLKANTISVLARGCKEWVEPDTERRILAAAAWVVPA